MNKSEKRMRRLRKLEARLPGATPSQAAKLAGDIVRLKSKVFDEV